MRAHHRLILENLGQNSIDHEKRIRALERGESNSAGDLKSLTERVRADVRNLVRAEIAAIGDPGRDDFNAGYAVGLARFLFFLDHVLDRGDA